MAEVSGNPSSKWHQESSPTSTSSNVGDESQLQSISPCLEIAAAASAVEATAAAATGGAEKCTMEEWESVFSGSVEGSPNQEHYWVMGDVEDPTISSFNKPDLEFNTVFGNVDQGFGADPSGQIASCGGNIAPSMSTSRFPSSSYQNFKVVNPPNPMFQPLPGSLEPIGLNQMQASFEGSVMKPPVFGPQLMINQHHTQQTENPSCFLPLSYAQQEQSVVMPPQTKRENPGSIGGLEKELLMAREYLQQQSVPQGLSQQMQMRQGMGAKPKMGQSFQEQQQQAIMEQLYKAAELMQVGNLVLAQGILARLNQQLSPIDNPFHRAAFYFKEALQLLLNRNNNVGTSAIHSSPFSIVFKIVAYKSLTEISPIVQFANFTCNQAMLEVLEGLNRIHVIDFDIGYGGQWASFMQELSLRNCGSPSLKITAFASPTTHDQLELSLIRENLIHFATEIDIMLEFDIMNIDSLTSGAWSLQHHVSENEAIAVNLPVSSFSNSQLSLDMVLRFVKQLSPKVVVCVDRGCERTDLPFPNHVIHALQSCSNLLESLDAVNVNLDALQKIERFLVQPGIEKIVTGRFHFPEKTQHWRTLFLSSGFSPLTFSNSTETQAECVVKRTPVRGFHVEKIQSSLVLCWQQKELISTSAWRC